MYQCRISASNNRIEELDDKDADYELEHPATFFGTHINLIPLQNAVQSPRLFYGARFMNQAMPLRNPEAPLVQNLADTGDGRSFDEVLGKAAGAIHAHDDLEVLHVAPEAITVKDSTGKKKEIELYNNHPFNAKTAITNYPVVEKGQKVKKGDLLAHSNYTDKSGTLAMGLNARVGLVPYKGWSMDDAIVISEPFAARMQSEHTNTYAQDFDHDTRGGLHHYVSLFAHKFTKAQLANIDENGVVKPGSILHPGDPMILATRPRAMNSTTQQLGRLSKIMKQTRSSAAQCNKYHEIMNR